MVYAACLNLQFRQPVMRGRHEAFRVMQLGMVQKAHRVLRILHMHLDEMFELGSGIKVSHLTPKDLHICKT